MKVKFGGKEIEAEPIGFSPLSEPWYEFHLEDKSILRVKFVLTAAYKATEQRADDGSPLYVINYQSVVVVIPGEQGGRSGD